MQPPNTQTRIKLNRNAFRIDNRFLPKRRRLANSLSVSDLTDPISNMCATGLENAVDSESSNNEDSPAPSVQDQDVANLNEPSQKNAEDTGEKPHLTGYDKGILLSKNSAICFKEARIGGIRGLYTRSRSTIRNKASTARVRQKEMSCRLRFVLCFSDETVQDTEMYTRHGQIKPDCSTVLCYVNGSVSAMPQFGAVPRDRSVHLNGLFTDAKLQRRGRQRRKGVILREDDSHLPMIGSHRVRGKPGTIRCDVEVKNAIKREVKQRRIRGDEAKIAGECRCGQAPRRSVRSSQATKPGTQNFNRKAELKRCLMSLTSFESGQGIKRSVKNPCCALCGDIKYIPPNGKLAHVHKSRSLHQGPPRRREGSQVLSVVKAQQTARVVILLGKYPKVRLCDVARVFDVTSPDFSCVLPVALQQKRKHKRVRCFKKEFRSLMQLCSYDVGDRGKWIASQRWEVCTPTNRCASLSSGEQHSCVWDVKDSSQGCARTSGNYVAQTLDCKNTKPAAGEEAACVPFHHGGVERCRDPSSGLGGSAGATAGQQDTAASVCLVPPLFLRRVFPCGDLDSSLCSPGAKSLNLDRKTEEQRSRPMNGVENVPLEGEAYTLDPFSCQRTRAYVMWPHSSCARTFMSWPFPRRGPPCEMKSVGRIGPRWIDSSVVSDYRELGVASGSAFSCLNSTTDLTTEKNMKIKLRKLFGLAQDGREHTHSAKLHEMQPDLVEEDPKTVEKYQNSLRKSAESDHGTVESSECSPRVPAASTGTEPVHLPQPQPAVLGPVDECTSEALKNDSCNVTNNQKDLSSLQPLKQNDCPVKQTVKVNVILPQNPVSTHETKSVVLSTSSTVTAPSPSLCKVLKGGVYETKATTSHPPAPLLDPCLKLKAPQTLPLLVCPKEKMQTTPIEHLNAECNPPLCHRTSKLNLSPPSYASGSRCYTSLISKGSSSSSCEDEDTGGLSPDPDYLLQENEMSEINKAKQDPSPECSVVASGDMDVLRAYAEDAIVLDVIQDDPELFGVVAMETEGSPNPKTGAAAMERSNKVWPEKTTLARNHRRIIWAPESKSPRKAILNGSDVKVENPDGSCTEVNGGSGGSRGQLVPSRNCPTLNAAAPPKQTKADCNNNVDETDVVDVNVRSTVNHTGSTLPVMHSSAHGMAGKDGGASRPSPTSYCWYYFSDCHSCLWVPCRYLHVPREEDEKFCMDMVQKFCHAGNSHIVCRAVEVFVEYYRTCSPGISFSPNIVNSLLSSLLNLGLLSELASVINILLAHKRTPSPEVVLALYEHVRERGLLVFVRDLLLLTSKIVEAGGRFTVDQWNVMQAQLQVLQVPRQQMETFSAVQCRALATNPQTAELSELVQAMIQVEVCKQQENWAGLASVFQSVCDGRHSVGELSRFCCSVTMALLKEAKDKLTLPYEPFAESVCHKAQSEGLTKSFLARVGVSLMCSYHRNQDWTKGVKLVCVMSRLRLEFSTLKGLLGSEDRTSRCQLITLATELFLNSGSIEGALNVLRANGWFVTSSTWPCQQTDVVGRKRVLSLLAERTSHRDTLEVLANLPGLGQPVDGVQVGEYCCVFNTHLQRCVMNQVLPVAADTLEFMLTQGIPADTAELQKLIHRLGKQNMWSRARTLFKHAHSTGYYADVVCTKAALALPCTLSEIEMTLAFEMFITRLGSCCQSPGNCSQLSPLVITLRRVSSDEVVLESMYLAAGCRLLSAALIPNPKLAIRYTAVNDKHEQLFHLDCSSATKWLTHNHSWAQEVWAV